MSAKLFSTILIYFLRKDKDNIHGTQETWLLLWALSGICLKTLAKSFPISAPVLLSALQCYLDSELKLGMFLESLLSISHKEKLPHLSE